MRKTGLLLLALLLCSCAKTAAPAPSEPGTNLPAQTIAATVAPTEAVTPTEPAEPTEPSVPEAARSQVKMSFVGDCLIGSDYGEHGAGSYNYYADTNDPSYFFAGVNSVFAADDLTVVDCETVLTDQSLSPIEKDEDPGYWYYGPAANAAAFAAGSVEIASTANNHTGDYGTAGFADTVAALEAAGVIAGQDLTPIYYDTNGVRVGVLCCNCWSSYHVTRILRVLEQMNEESDIQVIFPHGGSMNTFVPDEWRVQAFRSFIDAGAEVVAAGHPHVLQPLERYKDGAIVYSLGNFCYGGSTRPQNATVILSVTANFVDGAFDSLEYALHPCFLYTTPRNNYHPELIPPTDPAYNRILDFMYGLRETPIE